MKIVKQADNKADLFGFLFLNYTKYLIHSQNEYKQAVRKGYEYCLVVLGETHYITEQFIPFMTNISRSNDLFNIKV